jgi:hypothetical protein
VTPTRDQELAVLQSVVYASLFDYPLTLAQLHSSLVGVRAGADTIRSWWQSSEFLQATVEHRDGLYFPAGRCDLVTTRARREVLSRELLERDARSLAHLNAEGSADLDLFVITAPNRVWGVTVAVLAISRLLGWRKRMCLNYVVSETTMRIEPQDLFSANQIIHLRPICGSHVFQRFVQTNGFVRQFYPNFELPDSEHRPSTLRVTERVLALVAPAVERLARGLYGWHLRRRSASWHSRDQVRLEPECLKLHTSSHRAVTLEKFDAAMTAALKNADAKALKVASA